MKESEAPPSPSILLPANCPEEMKRMETGVGGMVLQTPQTSSTICAHNSLTSKCQCTPLPGHTEGWIDNGPRRSPSPMLNAKHLHTPAVSPFRWGELWGGCVSVAPELPSGFMLHLPMVDICWKDTCYWLPLLAWPTPHSLTGGSCDYFPNKVFSLKSVFQFLWESKLW